MERMIIMMMMIEMIVMVMVARVDIISAYADDFVAICVSLYLIKPKKKHNSFACSDTFGIT